MSDEKDSLEKPSALKYVPSTSTPSILLPAFDCHFSDIRPYLQHREECRKWYERYEQKIFIGQDIDEEKPCTCGLAKLEEKYGRSK